jgi:hypothetical protein
MAISIQNNKLKITLCKGTAQDLVSYSLALHSAIDFYLCGSPFYPINQKQAGNIYFLKCLDKYLQFEKEANSDKTGNLFLTINRDDLYILECFSESIDWAVQDILKTATPERLQKAFINQINSLLILRALLTPSLQDLLKITPKILAN